MIVPISDAALALVRLDMAHLLGNTTTRKQAQRALSALASGAVYRDWAGDVRAESSSEPGVWHLVTYDACTCKARVRCWHCIAYSALCRWEGHVRRMAAEEIEAPLFQPKESTVTILRIAQIILSINRETHAKLEIVDVALPVVRIALGTATLGLRADNESLFCAGVIGFLLDNSAVYVSGAAAWAGCENVGVVPI